MAWNKTIPDNDELLINFPALCRANWEAIELLTNANLQITNDKVAAAAAILDTKLAQITTASKVSGAALTLLTNVPAGAGVLPVANSPGKLKADAADATPQYLDSLINTNMFQITAGDLLEFKDGGVEAEKLESGAAAPGNWKFYGTEGAGAFGFRLVDHGNTDGKSDDDHTQYHNDARAVTWHDADDHSSLAVTGSMITDATAGDGLMASEDTDSTDGVGLSYAKVRTIKVFRDGTYRVKFDLKNPSGIAPDVYGRIYKNGVAHGTERSTSSGTYVTYSEDLVFAAGDEIQLYVHDGVDRAVNRRNFRVYVASGLIPTVTLLD